AAGQVKQPRRRTSDPRFELAIRGEDRARQATTAADLRPLLEQPLQRRLERIELRSHRLPLIPRRLLARRQPPPHLSLDVAIDASLEGEPEALSDAASGAVFDPRAGCT